MKIRYDINAIGFMGVFARLNRAKLKDCFVDEQETLVFVVEQGELGQAVGKHAMHVQMLERALKRKIKILEFNPDILQFLNNCFYPARIKDMQQEQGVVKITAQDSSSRGLMIGRNASKLRSVENIAKRYFQDIQEIKIA